MPLYAGICEADITPPIGVAMAPIGGFDRNCTAVHDPLFTRALVVDNGIERLAIVSADLCFLPTPLANEIRADIAQRIGTRFECVLIGCSGTLQAPDIESEWADAPYLDILKRKIAGVVEQAAANLEPANLTFGETSAQIGVSAPPIFREGQIERETDYAGPVSAMVQSLCVNGADGKLLALLFSHACDAGPARPDNKAISADWPGAAVDQLKTRLRKEIAEGGVREDAMPLFLSGCAADVQPIRLGSWEGMRENGLQIGDAVHAARWSAHGRQTEILSAGETIVALPGNSEVSPASLPVSWMQLGGIRIVAFPAAVSVQYQLDFTSRSLSPVLCVSRANGYTGWIGTAEYGASQALQGKSAKSIHPYCVYSSENELALRAAVYGLLEIERADLSLYPPAPKRRRQVNSGATVAGSCGT